MLAALLAVRVEAVLMRNLKEELRRQSFGIAAVIRAGEYQVPELQPLVRSLAIRFGSRTTLIASTGRVLADSEQDPGTVENHAGRPEVRAALSGEFGEALRVSRTLHERMLYVAAPVEPLAGRDVVVRVAVPTTKIDDALSNIPLVALASFLAVAAVAAIVSLLLTRTFTGPIGRMNYLARQLAGGKLDQRAQVATQDELGELSESLNRMAESLEASNKLRRDFIANVSHELKTPITGLKLMSETLARSVEEGDTEAAVRFAGKISSDMNRLSRLVDDLLVLSSLEAPEKQPNRRPVDVSELAREVVQSYGHLASERGLELGFSSEESLPPVTGDTELLRTLLENLIENAVKYTSEGKVEVSVRMRDGHTVVSVTDTGPGIAAEDQPRIFERFYRVDKDRSRASGGTGLGLSIAKHIAMIHGASLRVASNPGEGSVFSVEFPRAV